VVVNRSVALAACLALALISGARAEPIDAPTDVPEGQDAAYEVNDSLAAGEVELGLGLDGAGGKAPVHRRRVRFDEPDFSGALREGRGDPLAGGEVEARGAGEGFALGKLSPAWGRGVLLGSPAEPWQRAALARNSARRGRAGEGVRLSGGKGLRTEAPAGRFARRDLGGMRVRGGPLALGMVAGRRGELQSSLALARGRGDVEGVIDRRGTWRVEASLERPFGGSTLSGTVRAGRAGFHSLADPSRASPARAVTVAASASSWIGETRALAGAWRFRAGRAGARLAIECRRALTGGSRAACGFEEQQGVGKDDARAAPALRQGSWLEWSSREGPLALALRHESWGATPILRDVVRAVTSVRVDARAPFGMRVTLSHAVYRTRRGESLYLPESESDRLVLRALSGEGQRTTLELLAPAGRRGRVRATLRISTSGVRQGAPQWTLEWMRRSPRDRAPASSPSSTSNAPGHRSQENTHDPEDTLDPAPARADSAGSDRARGTGAQ